MNRMIVIIGIILCIIGIILLAVVLSQPPTDENPVRQNPNELPNALYFTSLLPIFVLSVGVWLFVVGIKR
jgi:hypothetical protein